MCQFDTDTDVVIDGRDGSVVVRLPVKPGWSTTWRKHFLKLAHQQDVPAEFLEGPGHAWIRVVISTSLGQDKVVNLLDRVRELMTRADSEAAVSTGEETVLIIREWWRRQEP